MRASCPFCGGNSCHIAWSEQIMGLDRRATGYYVMCGQCFARGPLVTMANEEAAKAKAGELWDSTWKQSTVRKFEAKNGWTARAVVDAWKARIAERGIAEPLDDEVETLLAFIDYLDEISPEAMRAATEREKEEEAYARR